MAQQVRSFEYVPVYGGDEGLVLPYTEADSETFVEGDLVLINAGGDISLATAGGTNQILGIAKADATNVTTLNARIPVQIIRPTDLFRANFASGTTFVITMNGEIHQIVRTAAGNWEVASGVTAADARVKVMGSLEFDATNQLIATSGGPIYVRFLAADGTPDDVLQYSTDSAV